MGTIASLVPGAVLADRYRLHSRLATERPEELWRGTDAVLARAVAITFLPGDDVKLAGFRDRARLTGAVTHEGIIRVYDYNEAVADSPPFFVTEYVEGSPLAELMTHGPMPPALVMNIWAQAARALHAAHSAGLAHGGIKPGNVLVGRDGTVKITDFGAESEPQYRAPELAGGEAGTVAADLYALGTIVMQCLSGTAGDNRGGPAPLPQDVPAEMRILAVQLTDPDPARRPPDAATVAASVAGIFSQLVPHDGQLPAPRRPLYASCLAWRPALAWHPPRAWHPPGTWHAPGTWRLTRPGRHWHRSRAALPTAVIAAIAFSFMLGRGFNLQGGLAATARPPTVQVNAATVRGMPVTTARDALQRLGLVVGIVWLTTARASPGHVVTVWPTGNVPAGSSVVLVGSEPRP